MEDETPPAGNRMVFSPRTNHPHGGWLSTEKSIKPGVIKNSLNAWRNHRASNDAGRYQQ